jgi:prevent-host-death family protein
MTRASAAEVKAKFGEFLKASEGDPVVVTRNGKPVAVLIGTQDEEEVERLVMAYSAKLRAILDESSRQIDQGLGLSEEAFWAEVEGRKPAKGKNGAKRRRA